MLSLQHSLLHHQSERLAFMIFRQRFTTRVFLNFLGRVLRLTRKTSKKVFSSFGFVTYQASGIESVNTSAFFNGFTGPARSSSPTFTPQRERASGHVGSLGN